MIRVFNALQCTSLFAVAPTLLALCRDGSFNGASILFWIGSIVYIILFVLHVAGISNMFKDL